MLRREARGKEESTKEEVAEAGRSRDFVVPFPLFFSFFNVVSLGYFWLSSLSRRCRAHAGRKDSREAEARGLPAEPPGAALIARGKFR